MSAVVNCDSRAECCCEHALQTSEVIDRADGKCGCKALDVINTLIWSPLLHVWFQRHSTLPFIKYFVLRKIQLLWTRHEVG